MFKRFIYISILLVFISCCNTNTKQAKMRFPDHDAADCFVQRDNTHELLENYFKKGDTLTHRIVIHYFVNGQEDQFSNKYFESRIDAMGQAFSHNNRFFEVVNIVRYDQKPESYPMLYNKITLTEEFQGTGNLSSLRENFDIRYYKYWNKLLEVPKAINIYVYGNLNEGYGGVAGGIGSTFMAIRWDYLNVLLHSLEHEMGHCLGLEHTHEETISNGLNNWEGDEVCDTPTTEADLYAYMNENCDYMGNFFEGIPIKCQENSLRNYMAYNIKGCRTLFTVGQDRKMNSTLEQIRDLRNTIIELDKPLEIDIISDIL